MIGQGSLRRRVEMVVQICKERAILAKNVAATKDDTHRISIAANGKEDRV